MSELIVNTRSGAIRGRAVEDVRRFLGVPYAAAPVGELRLRPPHEAPAWTGVRDATEFGPVAPQLGEMFSAQSSEGWRYLDGNDEAFPQDEDCLTLNIWTAVREATEARPVMVWLHGGGLRSGSGRVAAYDGEALARRGVVVVTLNYRLGILGFLCHPDLADGDGPAGNWGLLDQLAALKWVRDNIAAFGGDPQNVTVFGQSAGGSSIVNLLALPERRACDKAILQSSAPKAIGLEEGARLAEKVAEIVGVRDVADLRQTPVASILDAQRLAEGRGSPMTFLTTIDGRLFSEPPLELIRAGRGLDVPCLFGTMRDEWRRFLPLDPTALDMDAGALARRLGRAFCGDVSALIAAYAARRNARGEVASPGALWFDISTDSYFRLPGRRFETAVAGFRSPAYAYVLDSPCRMEGGRYGTFHSFELPLVFGTWSKPVFRDLYGAEDAAQTLSDTIMGAWVAFARSGDPSTPVVGEWPKFTSSDRKIMVLGPHCQPQADPFAPALEVLAGLASDAHSRGPLI